MPTASQRNDVRADLGQTDDSMPDAEIDRLYERAEADYTDNTRAIEAQVRLLAIRSLMAQAAKLTDYQQNQTQEKRSQVLSNLKALKALYDDELTTAVNNALPMARWGGLRKKPTRQEEYPDEW